MEKEFEVTISVRNNRLKKAREALGLSQKEFGVLLGISLQSVCALEGLRVRPMNPETGEWSALALRVSDVLETDPEELFPEAVRRMEKNRVVLELSANQAQALVGDGHRELLDTDDPETLLLRREGVEEIRTALVALPPRTRELVVNRFFGDQAYKDAADGLSRERSRQIIETGLSLMRRTLAKQELCHERTEDSKGWLVCYQHARHVPPVAVHYFGTRTEAVGFVQVALDYTDAPFGALSSALRTEALRGVFLVATTAASPLEAGLGDRPPCRSRTWLRGRLEKRRDFIVPDPVPRTTAQGLKPA